MVEHKLGSCYTGQTNLQPMKYRLFFLFTFVFSFFIPTVAVAGDPKPTILDNSYSAKFVSQSVADPFTIEAGSTKTVIFKFKNTGTTTWNEKGSNYISAYTVEPKYRNSDFRGSSWMSAKQTGKIKGVVKAGAAGELSIDFKAPTTAGEYIERFYLSSENHTWVQGGYFFVKIKVVPGTSKSNPIVKEEQKSDSTVPSVSVPVSLSPFQAKFMGVSKPQVTVRPGEQVNMMFLFQNVGAKPWLSYSFKGNEQISLAGVQISFADASWKSATLVKAGSINTPKDAILQKSFSLKAPEQVGKYKAAFYLEVDGQKVDGGEAFVDITVTNDTPEHIAPEVVRAQPVAPAPRVQAEPKIRVGLDQVTDKVIFTSSEDEYDVFDGETVVLRLPLNASATLSSKSGTYTCLCNGTAYTSKNSFRFVPVNNIHAVFKLGNFERTVPWQKGVNFNTYHGGFELRFPKKGDLPYAINELLFEDYVAGIREVSNGTPMEYMKSQAILERTYAYYIQQYSTKHDDRFFDVVAHTGDQLYLGYESEKLMPRFVEAVNATRGLMVVFDTDKNPATQSDIILTPYFGNSDGMTRSYKQVWGGKEEKSWLMPVPAIYDKRDKKKMYGHGVGMSQRDAMIKANEEKLDYAALIKYYYTGVEIEQIY